MKQLLKRFLPGVVILSLLLALLPFSLAGADNDGVVVVSIEVPAEDPVHCENITVNVTISNVTNLDSCQFKVTYNTSILEVIGAEGGAEGVTDGMVDSTTVPVDMWSFDPLGEPGTLFILGNVAGLVGASGTGYLCQIHFHVIGSSCQTSNITLSSGHLWDNAFPPNEIPVAEWLGDSVHVIGVPILCTDPDPPSHNFGDVVVGETEDWYFEITNCGTPTTTLTWDVTAPEPWITVKPTSGSTTTETDVVTVTVNTTELEACTTHTGYVYVTSNGGTKTGTITVHPAVLVADFSATPRTGVAPLIVQFTDKTAGGVSPYDYEWNFGDGTKSTAKNPTHIYIAVGSYTITLEVTDDVGDSDTERKMNYITVLPERVVGEPNLFPSDLHISPEQAQPNQHVSISVNIINSGEETGIYDAVLHINGYLEDSRTVSVEPGSTREVVFDVTKTEPRTYYVSLAGLEGQFTVVVLTPTGLGTGGIILIIVVVILLIVALVFLIPGIRRRE